MADLASCLSAVPVENRSPPELGCTAVASDVMGTGSEVFNSWPMVSRIDENVPASALPPGQVGKVAAGAEAGAGPICGKLAGTGLAIRFPCLQAAGQNFRIRDSSRVCTTWKSAKEFFRVCRLERNVNCEGED